MSGQQPTWETSLGRVEGWADGAVHRATGIRYATAQRFRPPVPVGWVPGPIRATTWSPAAPQNPVEALDEVLGSMTTGLRLDEDCLHLSVTVPADLAPDESLPVMVWFHGGAYVVGAGDAPMYDLAPLVSEQRVVGVAVTYRLGLLGYVGREGVPANLGLLDQIAALRWVQDAIAAFGGDPGNVTLFGQSAGGDAVAHLVIAQGTQGLFRRAIVQSAPLGIAAGRERMYAAIARRVAALDGDTPVADILAVQRTFTDLTRRFGVTAMMPFGVTYGQYPLPPEDEAPTRWARAAHRVDMLVGYTSAEAALFVPPRLADLPGGQRLRSRIVERLTERVYGVHAGKLAAVLRAGGGRGGEYVLSWGPAGNPYAGAHMADLPLLFGTRAGWQGAGFLDGVDWADLEASGARLRAIWGAFARDGHLEPTDIPGLIRVRPFA